MREYLQLCFLRVELSNISIKKTVELPVLNRIMFCRILLHYELQWYEIQNKMLIHYVNKESICVCKYWK